MNVYEYRCHVRAALLQYHGVYATHTACAEDQYVCHFVVGIMMCVDVFKLIDVVICLLNQRLRSRTDVPRICRQARPIIPSRRTHLLQSSRIGSGSISVFVMPALNHSLACGWERRGTVEENLFVIAALSQRVVFHSIRALPRSSSPFPRPPPRRQLLTLTMFVRADSRVPCV